MARTGAQAVIEVLLQEGVEIVFGYPGGAVLPLYHALADSPIKHILVRHEQSAVHAASGYARASGKVGVCFATSGPGATNLVTGIATAYMDSIPVVVITGQVPTSMVGTDAFQEVDVTGITMPITKHNYLVKDVAELPRIVKEAFYIARTGRPGPVLIDLPRDVALSLCEEPIPSKVEIRGYKPTYKGHPGQIRALADLLLKSERPIIFVGGGVIASGAEDLLLKVAETLQAPVATTLPGLGAFPEDHPLSLGMVGLHGKPYANHAVMECDVLFGIGVRFDDRVTGALEKFAPQAKIAHVDIDPAEIGKNVRVDLPLVGDARTVLADLLPLLKPVKREAWLKRIKQLQEEFPLTYGRGGGDVRPQWVIQRLGEMTRGRAIITTDVGQHQMWAALYYGFTRPRTFISSCGLGTMGYGFPAAIGAKLARPEEMVWVITGDGSFQMGMAELGTAMEHELPIKILLFNNQSLAMVRQLQHFYYEAKYTAVHFHGNPDFVRLAEAYGAVGLRVTRQEEVIPALKEAMDNGRLTLIECLISEEEMVYPMVPVGAALNEMILPQD
ncbi:MAG: biosynthetic-type acetolactate synthase large subunit [Thermanaeromonas sp.]|uniref:biosynthetic-type acetolactate synthase large subunit n=1 Tax=Thermanaeromonas sp. TaxID=2003697 RepID=UPI00243D3716|nr:biosynthetic-type acetolactate synthase large subunit [Thermanaeromonas sp.]MCG0278304.1 biosynthetic-type acetolactate synthase large subunit [Thermanaeromonas sp.]